MRSTCAVEPPGFVNVSSELNCAPPLPLDAHHDRHDPGRRRSPRPECSSTAASDSQARPVFWTTRTVVTPGAPAVKRIAFVPCPARASRSRRSRRTCRRPPRHARHEAGVSGHGLVRSRENRRRRPAVDGDVPEPGDLASGARLNDTARCAGSVSPAVNVTVRVPCPPSIVPFRATTCRIPPAPASGTLAAPEAPAHRDPGAVTSAALARDRRSRERRPVPVDGHVPSKIASIL